MVLSILNKWHKCCGGWVAATSFMNVIWSEWNTQMPTNIKFWIKHFFFSFLFFFQIIMNEFTFHSQTAHSTYLELERKNSSEGEPCRDQEVEWAERCHVARHTPLHPPPSFSSLSWHTLTHTWHYKWNEMLSTTSLSSLCYWLRFVHFFQSLFWLGSDWA